MSTQTNTNMATVLASDPDCDVVDELFQGFAQFLVLENALKTDILDHLDRESSPVSVATLSTKYGYNGDVLERLLDNLACMKLVRKHPDAGTWKYSNTRPTSVYLTKNSQFYKGDAIQADKVLIGITSSSIVQTLKTGPRNQMEKFMNSGKMANNANNNNNNNNNKNNNNNNTTKKDSNEENSDENQNNNNPTLECGCETPWCQENDNAGANHKNKSMSPLPYKNPTICDQSSCAAALQNKPSVKVLMKSMDAMMYSCRHVIPATFDLSEHRVAVDLGGGTGYLARLLTDFYPQLTTTVFELPHVVAMARTSEECHQGNGRVSFVAGNFFEDDLPPADLYIVSRVLHGWDGSRLQTLLGKIYSSLQPGGKLLILEKFLNERKDGPSCIMNIHLNMSSLSEGRERTAEEYQGLVEKQGFSQTQVRVIAGVNLFDALLTCKPL